jgi:glycosyltransferase involved in cell wall biosynthesis
MDFQLEKFECLAYSRQYEQAMQELLKLLQMLDGGYGSLNENFSSITIQAMQVNADLVDLHILTRIAAATTALFSDPEFHFSETGFIQVIQYHRWISVLFAVSPFRNSDHIIRSFNQNGPFSSPLQVDNNNLAKFCLLYSLESEIEIDPDALWQSNKLLAANLYLVLMSSRFVSSPEAHAKRETLLRWLPERLLEIGAIDQLPVGIFHDVYMHCSYSGYAGKHAIKASLNQLMRHKILELGFSDRIVPARLPAEGKPVMLVVLEWFYSTHSVYRVLSKAIRKARNQFYLIGMGEASTIDDLGRAVFDEFIDRSDSGDIPVLLHQVTKIAEERDVQVLYMPSVGMTLYTMFMANLRFAPLQITTLGHSASTFSPQMDYFIIDEDFVGDDACFSEQVIKTPNDAFPFTPFVQGMDQLPQAPLRENPSVVEIAMVASTMKLNPDFLHTCRLIAEQSPTPVHFQFFIGAARGLVGLQVTQVVERYLGKWATVNQQQGYAYYLQQIASCDLYINPFPFGNMNGIVDLLSVGLVGICKSGNEPHEHIDQGLFERLGMPDWLVTTTTEEYIQAALRLINNHEERLAIRNNLDGHTAINRLFEGRDEIFGQLVQDLHQTLIKQQSGN